MKKYQKPALQVKEVRVMENLAAITPAGRKLSWLNSIPTTVYSFGSDPASPGKTVSTPAPTVTPQ